MHMSLYIRLSREDIWKMKFDVIISIIWSAEKGICNVSEVGKSGYAA